MAEQEKSDEEIMEEYRRNLISSHPLNRRQFLRDRVNDLKLTAAGAGLSAIGGGLAYGAEKDWDEAVENMCENINNQIAKKLIQGFIQS